MHISLKNIGPIKTADLEIDGITVLFGPPNSGKSYTLKALYSALHPLNPRTLHVVLERKMQRLRWDLLVAFQAAYKLASLGSYLYRQAAPANVESYVSLLAELAGLHGISVTFEKERALFKCKWEGRILVSIRDLLFTLGLLPLTKSSKILINSKEVGSWIADTLARLSDESQLLVDPIKRELSFASASRHVSALIEVCQRGEALDIMRKFELVVHLGSNTNISRELPGKWRRIAGLLKQRAPAAELRSVFKELLATLPHPVEALTVDRLFNAMLKKLAEALSACLKSALEFQDLLYIPFGRTILLDQLESFAQDPLGEHQNISVLGRNEPHLGAYLDRLSRGKRALIQSQEGQDSIRRAVLDLMEFVLQGELTYDKHLGLLYKSRHARAAIPIKFSSALASETAGLFLPFLDTTPNTLILIEEPETQLHYSAQVFVVISLVILSTLLKAPIVLSTHSDLIVMLLATFGESELETKQVEDLLVLLYKAQGYKRVNRRFYENILRLIENEQNENRIKLPRIRFYHYRSVKGQTTVQEKSPEDVLKRIPGITEVIKAVTDWIFSV